MTQARQADSKLPHESDPTNEVHINTSEIPAFRRREIAKCVLASVKQAMLEPGAEEEFRAWLAEYKKKQGNPQGERS